MSDRRTEMEMNKPKYLAISAAALLVTAFALIQPTMQAAQAVGIAGGVPGYDDCSDRTLHDDPISQNTVRNGHIVKTIHAEKEVFDCELNQGDQPVIVDVTTYIEVYENITSKKVLKTSVIVTTCLKDEGQAIVHDCESYVPGSGATPVGTACKENTDISHPQEMNTVNKGKIAKTIETQKEVFNCDNINYSGTDKKVDIVLFTEIFEDLTTKTVLETQFYAMRCVVLVTDNDSDTDDPINRDGRVESCIWSQFWN